MRTIRALLPYLTVALAAVLLYSAWIMLSRRRENRAAERRAKAAEAQDDKRIVDLYGGGRLKILSFYASPGAVHKGGRTLLCYGVANATSVHIEPHLEDLTPSPSRCLEVFPKHSVEYKLTAEDAHGHSETVSLLLRVE